MDIREHDIFPPELDDIPGAAPGFGVVAAIVVAVGFAVVAAWFAQLVIDERRGAPADLVARASCAICGVIERVSVVEPASPQVLEGSRAEGTVFLLAALGGAPAPGARQARIYETSVLHDDGTVRVLREPYASQWKPGDRVKVVRGQVAPDASQTERTANPGLPAAPAR